MLELSWLKEADKKRPKSGAQTDRKPTPEPTPLYQYIPVSLAFVRIVYNRCSTEPALV